MVGVVFIRARKAYTTRLWNGKYMNYDASTSIHHDSIMADQMAGQWYARACNLPNGTSGLVDYRSVMW